ncbi:MAG TPA: hypothetical protein VIG51_05550 [Candidatus Baltobacteraceae bacterium]
MQDDRAALHKWKRRKCIVDIHGIALIEMDSPIADRVQCLGAWAAARYRDRVVDDDFINPRRKTEGIFKRRQRSRHRGTRLLRSILGKAGIAKDAKGNSIRFGPNVRNKTLEPRAAGFGAFNQSAIES